MANLAIKGHATRGKEVIEILEMLGGKNRFYYDGTFKALIYTIGSGLELEVFNIHFTNIEDGYIIFTLEEFLEKFPYKVGDKVYIKKSKKPEPHTIAEIRWNEFENTIQYVLKIGPIYQGGWETDSLQPYKEETMEIPEKLKPVIDLTEYSKDEYIIKLGNYEIKEVDGVVKAVRKQSQYPKTYEECCDVLKIEYPYFKTEEDGISASTYKNKLFGSLKQLIICRDAYWKIAGEQMGLDKPWEPDYRYRNEYYSIYYNGFSIIQCNSFEAHTFIFPTEEMRDAFYENFKDLIEQCKELL